ncbi:MAG: hypothetical protein E7646_04875 [Ruminococcaceae bacterium]|nr:hypothetical protein [Oscillospiraceae bacterium]
MKKLFLILFVFTVSCIMITGCSKTTTNTTHMVDLIADLKEVENVTDGDVIIVKGYNSVGDAGAGEFVYYSNYDSEEDGGVVFNAKDGGKYVRICSPTQRHVAWYGATANDKNDDSSAIRAAISSLKNGGTVNFSGGDYYIAEPLVLDSSANNIKLIGKGGWYSTKINALSEMDTMIHVKGVDGITIDSIHINGGLLAKNTLILESITNSVIKNSRAFQFTKYGIKLTAGESGPSKNNTFDQLNAITTHNKNPIYCFYIGGDYSTGNIVENCTFSTCRFDYHQSPNSVALTVEYAQMLSFYRCHFVGYNERSDGLRLNARNNNGYPGQLNVYDCSITDIVVDESNSSKIGNVMLFGHGTYDNEVIPVNENIHTITDEGSIFGYQLGDGTKLPIKTAPFQTNTNGEYAAHNLKTEIKNMGIRFNNGGLFTGGSIRLATYSGSPGCELKLSVYKWNTDFKTTISGEELRSCIFKEFEDNSMVDFKFEEPLGEGEYLVLLHDGKSDGYGVGVWTQNPGQGIKTFTDGKDANFGICGIFNIE